MKSTILSTTILSLAVISIFSVGPAMAMSGAYYRGYADAIRDFHTGHGYDPSCPNASEHSEAYCTNYHTGYDDGWNEAKQLPQLTPPLVPQPQQIPTPTPTPQPTQWTLTVYLKPGFGTKTVYVEADGPFGDRVSGTFSTGPGAYGTLQLPTTKFPSNYYFNIGIAEDNGTTTAFGPYIANGTNMTFTYELGGLSQGPPTTQ